MICKTLKLLQVLKGSNSAVTRSSSTVMQQAIKIFLPHYLIKMGELQIFRHRVFNLASLQSKCFHLLFSRFLVAAITSKGVVWSFALVYGHESIHLLLSHVFGKQCLRYTTVRKIKA